MDFRSPVPWPCAPHLPPLGPLAECPAALASLERQGKNTPPGGDEPLAETESESEAELAGFSPVVRPTGDGVSSRRLGKSCPRRRCHLSRHGGKVASLVPSPVVSVPGLQVDVKKTALALAITDSELSDEEASILESGGFSVSRATTPQLTDVSEGTGNTLPLLIFLGHVIGLWLYSLALHERLIWTTTNSTPSFWKTLYLKPGSAP